MLFRQVLHDDLGCASYVVAAGGEAAVIDPKWEIEDYLALSGQHGFRITHIVVTHNHADHVSGRGRLRAATGATIHISADAGVDYEHEALEDGDVLELGDVRILALATPGHRPEHLAYVVQDRARSEEPQLVATGDSLFVGDVARPDLAVDPEEGARGLYASLRRLSQLPDYVEVWPGHIGGSLCGGSGTSKKPSSTVGFERRHNPYLTIADEDEFVRRLTSDLPPQPPNFERMVALNRGPLLAEELQLELRAPERVRQLIEAGAVLVDGRTTREFDAAHVPGSINVTTTEAAVGTRAAWVLDPDVEVVTVAASDADALRLARLLEAVGFRRLRGIMTGGIAAWQDAGLETSSTPAIDASTLASWLREGEATLVDVREADEWADGHVEGSLHLPYHHLRDGVPDELRAGADWKVLAVACSAGNRSSLATSLLRRGGVEDVVHVATGGVEDLEREGVPLVKERQ